MNRDFVSYAFQDLPRKKIKKYAAQYDGVNMAELMGADEDNYPFLVRSADGEFQVMIWNAYNGMIPQPTTARQRSAGPLPRGRRRRNH
jgi:hypothetical protein